MKNSKVDRYTYEMTVPVMVLYSKRNDDTVSIDCVSVPSEDELYRIVGKHAVKIKAGAKLRMGQ